MNLNIRNKFLIPTVALIVAGLGISTLVSYLISRNAIEKFINTQLFQLADSVDKHLTSWVTIVRKDIAYWSEQNYFRMAVRETFMGKASRKAANRYLKNEKEHRLFYESLQVANERGEVILSSDSEALGTFNVSGRQYFQEAIQGKACLSDIAASPVSGKPVFFAASPIQEREAIVGVLFGIVNLEYFNRTYLDSVNVEQQGYAYMINKEGVIVAHPDRSMILKPDAKEYDDDRNMPVNQEGAAVYTFKGEKNIGVFRKNEETGWVIAVAADFSDIMTPVRSLSYVNLFILVVAIVITAGVSVMFSKVVSIPLKKAANLADSIRQGDFSQRLNMTTKDEIGQLSNALDDMSDQLYNYTSSLAARNNDLENEIAERKQAEEALKASEQDLQDLIYIASHDLQTPIVSMVGYATNILTKHAQGLDEKGVYALQRLKANAERLHKLILSLLDISRLNTVRNPYRSFDPEQVVRHIMEDLELPLKELGAEFVIEALPTMYGDEPRLTTVFRNVLSNAIKYGGKHILVGYRDGAYFIRDDGIGIAARNLEKIFNAGERLKKIEVDGVGMGLTFCQKVIRQHKGRMWIESEGEGKGSTCYFTIAAAN